MLWGEALLHVTWVKNRSATQALEGKTLYGMLYGKKPHLGDLLVWGTKCWVLDHSGLKLDDHTTEGHWVRYDSESTVHRTYLPDHCAIVIKQNVTFQHHDKVALIHLEDAKDNSNDQRTSPIKPVNDAPNSIASTLSTSVPVPDKQSVNHLGSDFEDLNLKDEPLQCSDHQHFDSTYICMLQSGDGTHNRQVGNQALPKGMHSAEGTDKHDSTAWELDDKEAVFALLASSVDAPLAALSRGSHSLTDPFPPTRKIGLRDLTTHSTFPSMPNVATRFEIQFKVVLLMS